MSINNNLRRKSFGIMKSIESMNEKERDQLPSDTFGLNYNKLRELCLESNPELKEFIPPPVTIVDYGGNGYTDMRTKHNFSEIHTYCSEIYHLTEL